MDDLMYGDERCYPDCLIFNGVLAVEFMESEADLTGSVNDD
jgi:hypothetical protein